MHLVFLTNENGFSSAAVGVMAVALVVALVMVGGLGAYVIYCDMLNRAGERTLVPATEGEAAEGHSVMVESHAAEAPAETSEPAAPAAKARRSRTPKQP